MKGIIYSIIQIDTDKTIYIGSSKSFYTRVKTYKSHYHSPKYTQYFNKLNTYMRMNGGWTAFKFIVIKELEVRDIDELRQIEQTYLDEHTDLLNDRRSVGQRVGKYVKKSKAEIKTNKEKKIKDTIIALCQVIDISDERRGIIQQMLA